MKHTILRILVVLLMLGSLLTGCAKPEPTAVPTVAAPTKAPAVVAPTEAEPTKAPESTETKELILATTTSTDNSGLLAAILPDFEKSSGVTVKVVAVGTGQALQLGADGNADVLLVHARAREDQFMADGHGVRREDVMYNDFVILGPESDPVGIKGGNDAAAALEAIAAAEADFVSRGDDSGTHTKEKSLWKAAEIEPAGDWYISAGQGMGAVITMANEQEAYTMSDRATYLARTLEGIDLIIAVEGDPILFNPYGVMAVNPNKGDHIKHDLANEFIDWLVSVPTQELIGQFGVDEFGSPLFTPDSTAWRASKGGAAPAAAGKAVLDLDDIDALTAGLEKVTLKTQNSKGEDKEYTGYRLIEVLKAGGAMGDSLNMIASDGYAAEVVFSDLTDDSLLAIRGEGGYDGVMPGMPGNVWVKDIVTLEISGVVASSAPAAPPVLTVNGKGITQADLDSLKTVTVKSKNKEGKESDYTGYRVSEVLALAGVSGATLTLVADDGYSAEVALADVHDECILSIRNQGGFSSVMPGLSGKAQVKGVVQLNVTGDAAAARPQPAASEPEPVLTVNGKGLLQDDLSALTEVSVMSKSPDGQEAEYSGYRISDILALAGASGDTLTLVASDGFASEMPLSDLYDECILETLERGGFNAVMPGLSRKVQVKGVVELKTSGEAAAAAAAVITVGSVAFSMDDLKAMEQVTVDAKGAERTGVRVLDLLAAAKAAGASATLTADDGYSAEIPVASLDENCIMAYADGGKVDAVLPGFDGSAWVRSTITIEVSGTPASGAVEKINAGDAVRIEDALGRVVNLDHYPERIVVPGKGAWMVGHPLYLFPEARERVLAMEARRGTVSLFLSAFVEGFDDLPHLEENAAPEQIAPLKPDMVLTKSYMAKRLGEPMEALGFPVVYLDLESPDRFYGDMEILGQLFGNPDRADEINAYYQAKLAAVQERVKDVAEKPRVLVIQYNTMAEDQAATVPPASWMQTRIVELAGGEPVWVEANQGEGWAVVNMEQIAAWNPDVVLVIVFRADPEPVMAQIAADPAWQALDAAINDRIYTFPADYYGWDVPDPRWILGVTWAGTVLHPDACADVDMMAEVYDYYGQMYGLDKATVDRVIVPQLVGDIE